MYIYLLELFILPSFMDCCNTGGVTSVCDSSEQLKTKSLNRLCFNGPYANAHVHAENEYFYEKKICSNLQMETKYR